MTHALPLILGIEHLSDDLVLLATKRGANVLTARTDLSALSERLVWLSVQHALIKAGAEQVHVVAYPAGPVTDQVLKDLHAHLMHLAEKTPAGLELGWVITGANGRCWLHDVAGSAPAGPGTAVREEPQTALALKVARGVPAASRADIDAATRPLPPTILAKVSAAIEALPADMFPAQARTDVLRALERRRERPLAWTASEAASVLEGLRDVSVRDEMVLLSDEVHTTWTWSTLLPYAPLRWVAPVATLAAFSAYQHGHSILARSALNRALHADGGYPLARFLMQALDVALSPEDIRVNILRPAAGRLQQP
ncbi:DUF4192 family protein [Kineosporia babensis]|uniref:DUF4192 domain-containing protein n=1 Tax=Kineosporia babensis TaxID=499548 RepID=A0A9X1SYA7_9ACTN|nr:DUF4192 family protein [Kineosporia babensis]MCD5316150.1 DUF4192 domain-containing protein [Kineosporia babensis]